MYLSPELARYYVTGEGLDMIDARSDIYSLAPMYRSLTGAYPVVIDQHKYGSDARSMYLAVYEKLIVIPVMISPPCLTPYIDQVLDKALQRSRSDRFDSVKELADAYHAALKVPTIFASRFLM